MERIVNPAIPYLGYIGNFITGKTITIEGMVIPPGQWIVINLQTGKNIPYKDDVALQLCAGSIDGKIARNSMIDGLLGPEEISGLYPLTAGKKFKITIRNEFEKFVVTVNDNSFSYRHRLPSSRVNHISVQGDVKLYVIEYETYVVECDNFRFFNGERPPPYTPDPQEPQDETEEPSILENQTVSVGTHLGPQGTAQFRNLTGTSSESNDTHGSSCCCRKCIAALNPPREEQQQEQLQQSSGWSAIGTGLATVAAIGTAAGLIFSLATNKQQRRE